MINVIWVMIISSTLGKNKAFDCLQFEFNFVVLLNLNGEHLNFQVILWNDVTVWRFCR